MFPNSLAGYLLVFTFFFVSKRQIEGATENQSVPLVIR